MLHIIHYLDSFLLAQVFRLMCGVVSDDLLYQYYEIMN